MTTVTSVRKKTRAECEADPNFLYVGRRVSWRPEADWPDTIWGNPFRDVVGFELHLRAAIEKPDLAMRQFRIMVSRLHELRGKVLGCWCCEWKPGDEGTVCHAVVLARIVNEMFPEQES